jgi:nucleoside-diphosphate-sugar epimerase
MREHFLVAGGLGFIGSHLCRFIQKEGGRVTIVDAKKNYRQVGEGFYAAQMVLRQSWLPDPFELFEFDLSRGPFPIDSKVRYSKVIHLAGNPLVSLVERSPGLEFDEIIAPTENLLRSIENQEIDQFLYVSTSMVYGHTPAAEIGEGSPLHPQSRYGEAKKKCEVLVQQFCDKKKIPWTIIRPSAVYGSSDVNGRIIFKVLEAARRGEAVPIYNPLEVLNPTAVEDLVLGIWAALQRGQALGQIFNITYGRGYSLRELVALARRIFPELKVELGRPDTNSKLGVISISKARALLGFSPRISLEDGLAAYAQHLSGAPR